MKHMLRLTALVAVVVTAVSAVGKIAAPPPAAPAGVPKPLAALAMFAPGHFQPGLYRLSVLDEPASEPVLACIVRPDRLIRLNHFKAAGCSHLTVENLPDRATVHYSCPAGQWGRTSVHATDDGLLKIETQGIAGSTPFDETVSARRVGACQQH